MKVSLYRINIMYRVRHMVLLVLSDIGQLSNTYTSDTYTVTIMLI